MRKLISFVALFLCALISQAHVTISVADVAFGEVALSSGTAVATTNMPVTWTNLDSYEYIYAKVTEGSSVFSIENGATDIYGYQYLQTDVNPVKFSIKCSATATGTYNGKIHVYAWGDEDDSWAEIEKTINITLTVVSEKAATYTRIEKTADLKDGDEVVFVNETAGAISGPLSGAYLPAVKENVYIDKSKGTATVPVTTQSYTVGSHNGNRNFTVTGTSDYLLLIVDESDKNYKGFAIGAAVAEKKVNGWSVTITDGELLMCRPSNSSFRVCFNSDRFKPYIGGSYDAVALYKKAGESEAQSKLTITPETIDFGAVAASVQKEVTVTYATEHLTDLTWDLAGADKADFELVESLSNTDAAGTLTIKYKGTSTKTSPVVSLYCLYNDVKGDVAENEEPINITLVPFNGIAFKSATYKTNTNTDLDLSGEVTYDPTTLAPAYKGLTWKVSPNTFASVSEAGVLNATVSGDYTVTATSTLDPSKKAECKVTVETIKVTDFTLSATEIKLNVGGTQTLSVTAYTPAGASGTPTYESGDKTVATVSNKGLITAKKLGETQITVTVGEVNKTCKVIVEKVTVNSISFDKSEMNLSLGSSLQLDPTVDPAQAKDEYTMSWTSDKTDVATVSETGLVSSVAVGDAVITAEIAGKTANITIHVVAPNTFAKLTDPSLLAAKDTIILATIYESNGVIAGPRGTDSNGKKKLNVLTTDVTVTADEAYADNACRLVLGTEKGKEGYTLTIAGGATIAVTSSGNDIVDANTQNCKFWEFVADGSNGYYVKNLGNTNAMFKYLKSSAAVKPYKSGTKDAVYVYVYYRKFVDTPSAIDKLQAAPEAQKIIRNGQIIIIRNGIEYSIDGRQL